MDIRHEPFTHLFDLVISQNCNTSQLIIKGEHHVVVLTRSFSFAEPSRHHRSIRPSLTRRADGSIKFFPSSLRPWWHNQLSCNCVIICRSSNIYAAEDRQEIWLGWWLDYSCLGGIDPSSPLSLNCYARSLCLSNAGWLGFNRYCHLGYHSQYVTGLLRASGCILPIYPRNGCPR